MRRPTRSFLYAVVAFVGVALLLQGVGLDLPGALGVLTAVTFGASSSRSAEASTPAQSQAAPVSADLQNEQNKACTTHSCIVSNFHKGPILQGDHIWFDGNLVVHGLGSDATTIFVTNQTVTWTDGNHVTYNLPIPDASVTFDPALNEMPTPSSTVFIGNTWITNTPTTGVPGNTFFAGMTYQVPFPPIVGGDNPVTWCGDFASNTPGVKVQWKWGAAVYTTFPTDYNDLGAKAQDGKNSTIYSNSDHAGTPENYKPFLIDGARGGGSTNYTGGWTGTESLFTCQATPTPTLTNTPPGTLTNTPPGTPTNTPTRPECSPVRKSVGCASAAISPPAR